MEFKSILSIITIILVFISYAPYIRDTIKGTTRPYVFSYFLWSFLTFLLFALQLKGGGGAGAWITFAIAILTVVVFLLSLKNGRRDVKKIDYVFLGLAVAAVPLWLLAEQPVIANIILVTIDALIFIPIFRKTWVDPWSETLSLYVIASIRHTLAIFALAELNILTILFPACWVVINTVFLVMLIVRRKQVAKTS